ncbi:MAG: phosphotransferase family protein [Candidatus Limnocylindrales bacterium]
MPSDPRSDDRIVTTEAVGDGRLAATRRVDWRFLLDRPDPDVVLTAGRPDADLVAGLIAVAGSVRPLSASTAATTPADGDLVVVAGPLGDDEFAVAASAVRPGGWIVVETDGVLGRLRHPLTRVGPRHTTRTVRALRANGFEAVHAHLALPRREAATALVSLDRADGLATWLGRLRGGRKGRLARLAGRAVPLAIRTGALASLAAGSVVTGRRPGGAAASTPTAGWLRARLAAVDPSLLGGSDPQTADILLLTPRYEASAHVVALIVDRSRPAGQPRLVIKAARVADGSDTLAREGHALLRLAPTLGATGHAPRVLALDIDGTPPSLIETGLSGVPLDPRTVRRDRAAAASAVVAFAARLPVGSVVDDADGEMRGPGLALAALERLDRANVAPDLVERSRPLVERLRTAALPTVFEHGDLAHPNLVLQPDGTLGAVDWERAEPDGLPLHDLTMALAYIAAAGASAGTPDLQAEAFVSALTGEDAWAAPLLDAELDRLHIDRGLRGALIVVPWIRTAAFLAERATVDWLRTDRSVALWRATLDLADRDPGRAG